MSSSTPDLLGLKNREAGGFGDSGRIAGDGESFALIGPEDHDQVVALRELPIDRHMHHDISHAAAKVMAFPDGVPKVVVHVLVRRQFHELDAKAELLADGLGEIHVGAFKACRRRGGKTAGSHGRPRTAGLPRSVTVSSDAANPGKVAATMRACEP